MTRKQKLKQTKKRLTRTPIQVSHIQNHIKEIITYERENKKSIF